tara:strand:- start:866 stop:1912 length:1047 start_codon:yes stop_codon:yes gene_type:complete
MKHVFVSDLNTYELKETTKPQIQQPTDVIVRVTTTTVCGSDVHLLAGHMHDHWGYPLGHEFVGIIDEVGSEVYDLKVGDRVAAPAAPYCGNCDHCRRGQYQVCLRGGIYGSNMGNLGGAMAEYVRAPFADACLCKVPDSVTDAQAITVGDILGTGYTAVKNALTKPGQVLLVFGAGPVGLSALHTARLFGASKVIAVDAIADRLELAKKMGATDVINISEKDTVEAVMELTGGRGVDAIVDAAGVPATIQSWAAVGAVGAKVAMIGIPGAPIEVNFTELLFKNISIWTGLGDLAHYNMNHLLSLIENKVLDPTPIFTENSSFDKIETAISEFIDRKPGLVKPLVKVSE